MGTSSSWKMIVEKGIPKSPFQYQGRTPIDDVLKSSVTGEGGGKRRVTLPKQDEDCSDDDNDEDE